MTDLTQSFPHYFEASDLVPMQAKFSSAYAKPAYQG